MKMGVERRLLAYIAKKYPKPLHQVLHDPYKIPTEAMEERAKNENKLIPVLAHLPNWGIGRIVTSVEWQRAPPTFWRVTRVHVDYGTDNFEHGLVWGVFTARGKCRFYEEEIIDANEHLWRLIPKYKENYYLSYRPVTESVREVPLYVSMPPLLSQMYKAHKAKEQHKLCKDEPMIRMLIQRSPNNAARQKLNDGSLV